MGYELPLEEDPEFRQDYQDEYGNAGHYQVPNAHRPEHRLNKRKKALTAEPDYIWSKNPNTVHVEYRNRLGSGTHPDDVFKQILGEIADHYASGQISNRDAHRAANEAFGRYIMSNRRKVMRKQAWSGWGPSQKPKRHKVSGWQWDEYQNGYISNKPRLFQCSCGEPVRVPDYRNCKCGKIWNTYVIGTGGDRHEASAEKYIAREIPARKDVIVAGRKKEGSFLGHTPDHKIPEYLEQLRGKVRNQNISMGELSDLQGLASAGYIHPDDMELHEAAGTPEEDFRRGQDRDPDNDPFDPREFGAKRRTATDHFHDDQNRYTGPMKMNAPPDPYQGSDFCPGCGNHFAKGHDAECPHLTKWGKTNLHSPQQTHYPDYDKALNDWQHQEESETAFPTKHLPRVNSDTKGTNAKDWYRRDHATQRWTA